MVHCSVCCIAFSLLCTTGWAAVQYDWDTVTDGGKQDRGKVFWGQLVQRIVCPAPLLPPLPSDFTFKPSTWTLALLLKATREHTVSLSSLTPGAPIRGKSESLIMWSKDSLVGQEKKNIALNKESFATTLWIITGTFPTLISQEVSLYCCYCIFTSLCTLMTLVCHFCHIYHHANSNINIINILLYIKELFFCY